MFRRLAESFQDQDPILEYRQQQDVYFKTIPNIIPSASSGLKGFENAIQTVDTTGKNLQPTAIPYPDEIFRSTVSPDLQQFAQQCSTSSIDQLIAIKNPSLTTGCGWLYTPPNQGSPYPQVSQGFLGNAQGPLTALNPPEYKKWFFDLQLAKKQALIDKCKALKACTDVDSNVFKGSCGFCTDTNQGVPIDNVGKPLYVNDDIGGCNSSSIVLSGDRCPKMDEDGGPQPLVDRTCERDEKGRLPLSCMYRQVMAGGCSDNGALALVLANPSSDSSIRISDSVKIYNRVANPPLNFDLFRQGRGTVDEVLREVRQLASNTRNSETSALGASARELCVQRGSIQKYDMCLELSDSSVSPFDLKCLQQLFLKMGGQPKGTMYPTESTLPTYNAMNNLGAVKQYLNDLISKMKSDDYTTQRDAMMQFLGITPEGIVKRVPYQQGVEVFWFIPVPGNPYKVAGFLKRTIERDIVQIPYGVDGQAGVSQIGGNSYAVMLQMTDLRAPSDFSAKFKVTVDDGFWIAVNQPADIDKTAMNQTDADSPGLFENLRLQGSTTYLSTQCSDFSSSMPNIVKMYYENAGGGGFIFQLNVDGCEGRHYFQPPNYSLTCESRAPFLNYEVNQESGLFEETRNPGLFSQFLGLKSLDSRVRPEERMNVPGNKGFVRINNVSSLIDMPNIAFQSWKTVTFAIRLYTMPVKDTLVKFAVGSSYFSVILKPINGSTASVSIEHNFNRGNVTEQSTNFRLSLNKWYLVGVHNWGVGLTLLINGIDEMVANKGYAYGVRVDKADGTSLYKPNATWSPAPGQPGEACTIMLGTNGFLGNPHWPGMYATSAFQYDLAWIHFFQQMANQDDMYRECMVNWKYTQFPKSYNNYRS